MPKWTPQNTLLVQCIGTGGSIPEVKKSLAVSLNKMNEMYGARELHGYSGHPISFLSNDEGLIVYQRYFDFAFIRKEGDPEHVDIVNGVIE